MLAIADPLDDNYRAMRTDHSIRQLFHDKGLRCTLQRRVIFEALAETSAHPTADQLFAMVRERPDGVGVSLATVYNTLDSFASCGLVRRIPPRSASGPSRYDADCSEHVHVTMPDGRVLDVPEPLTRELLSGVTESLLRRIEDELGVRVDRVSIEITAAERD